MAQTVNADKIPPAEPCLHYNGGEK